MIKGGRTDCGGKRCSGLGLRVAKKIKERHSVSSSPVFSFSFFFQLYLFSSISCGLGIIA
jgi:hypothetical protein